MRNAADVDTKIERGIGRDRGLAGLHAVVVVDDVGESERRQDGEGGRRKRGRSKQATHFVFPSGCRRAWEEGVGLSYGEHFPTPSSRPGRTAGECAAHLQAKLRKRPGACHLRKNNV